MLRAGKWFIFLAAGMPAFLLAIPLNYLLVDRAGFSKALAYAMVLVFQITVNFFMCRHFVFERDDVRPLWQQFSMFFVGIAVFRVLDWGLYNLLVYGFGLYYLGVQLLNVFLFSVFKFLFSERLFQK